MDTLSIANWRKLGGLMFGIFAESPLGKTTLSLFGGNVLKLAQSAPKAIEALAPGVVAIVEPQGDDAVKITMKNEPHHEEHYRGIWEGALKYLGKKGSVSVTSLGPLEKEYLVTWEE